MTDDPFELSRFVTAQADSYDRAFAELRRGRKTSHWMWFVFPQLAGLGQSPISRHYAIASLDEARAYLGHPLLGPRLRESAGVIATSRRSPDAILGPLDAMKLRSCMTLFARAAPEESIFSEVLTTHFGARPDTATDRLLTGST